MSDFGPKITIKIVESLRDDIYAGKLKSGSEIKVLHQNVLVHLILAQWLISLKIQRKESKCLD